MPDFKGKILLTGGAGYIGSHICATLIEAGYDVLVFDNFENSQKSVLDRLEQITGKPIQYIEGSVLDADHLTQVFAEHKIDAVIHLAAKKAVGESTKQPLAYFESNIQGLINLLKVMEHAGVYRLVFSSSATVYGTPDETPTRETARYQAMSPYGLSKIMGEQILRELEERNPEWAFGILRYFNPVGAHNSALIGEQPSGTPNNLMPYVAEVALGQRDHLSVFGDDWDTPDGTGVRDYIHVEDLAHGHVLSLEKILSDSTGHLVNLGTGKGYSVLEVLSAYGRAVGRPIPHVIAPRRPGDVPTYCAEPSKAKEVLGFEAKRGLDEMCVSGWNWASRHI